MHPLFRFGFHPLKAGRRHEVPRWRTVDSFGFHPLKAGRRQARRGSPAIGRLCFHPLKAGRRPCLDDLADFVKRGFHPLKAGRRPPNRLMRRGITTPFPSPQGGSETGIVWEQTGTNIEVSIPSRRVGDLPIVVDNKHTAATFPSPQGGSETVLKVLTPSRLLQVSIPSRRVGDSSRFSPPKPRGRVSIPSRRVGDDLGSVGVGGGNDSFHPLKAGRRQILQEPRRQE